MKKYFLLSAAFFFIFAAFGVWKFEVYKKFPGLGGRHPASAEVTQMLEEDKSLIDAQAEFEEDHSAKKADAPHQDKDAKDDFKVKLEKIKPVKITKTHAKPAKHLVKSKSEHVSSSVATAEKNSVKHTVTKDETAWFLANVYYGKGQKFEEILEANGFSEPTEIKEGREIIVPNPKFHKGQSDFAAHYAQVWDKRAQALKERDKSVSADKYLIKAPMPSSKVVLPTEKIRAKDKTPQFPFTEIKEPHKSPAEKAREVLREAHGHQE